MRTVTVVMEVAASPTRCFDLARDIDLHMRSMAHTGERAVAGVTSGLIGPDQEVTWQARHFGVTQRFTSRITAFDPPHHFQDSMVRGAFASFVHDHYFAPQGSGTLMRDTLRFQSPLGPFGALADRLVLRRYLERLLSERAVAVKQAAERA